MIPEVTGELQQDFEIMPANSKTFRLNPTAETLVGYVDGLEAVKQAVYIILNVERYQHIIHSWDFGVELSDLFGKQFAFAMPELKRRIQDALIQDDRIIAVDSFEFAIAGRKINATFSVATIYGTFRTERAVEV